MNAIDTNILVRCYLDDDPEQATLAQRLIEYHPIHIPKTVILELEWVLRGVAKIGRINIISCFEHLLNLPTAHIESRDEFAMALNYYKLGLDFADAIHLVANKECQSFLTFDNKGFAKRANRLGCVPHVWVLNTSVLENQSKNEN